MLWSEYDRWNTAIADVVFSTEQAGLPAYLDLEDDVLRLVAAKAGNTCDDPAEGLISVVASTISHDAPPDAILRPHRDRVRRWELGKQVAAPPQLAFLAVTGLAAERMASGEGMSPNNYYGRLAPMLKMQHRTQDLALAYRAVAERWWSDVNQWLEHHDGRRGLPTAYTLSEQSHRYVGLPISQALVRAADRDGLVRFFQRVGFAPGTDVPPQALVPLLGAWINQNPSPATRALQRLWNKPSVRERVAEVAAVALASWDGTMRGRTGGPRLDETLRLVATVGGFLRPRLELGVLAYFESSEDAREVLVVTAEGSPHVTAVPATNGAMRLAGIEGADPTSLLDGILTVEDSKTGRRTSRRPKRVVPLRQNELIQQLVEADQIQAGEDLVLLVDRALYPKLSLLLDEVARPGWSVADKLRDVPARWLVVRDVQILRSPVVTPVDDLASLVPLTASNLILAGGFAIPGRLRRWHSWQPPEIRALDDSGELLTIKLQEIQSGEGGAHQASLVTRMWHSSFPGALVVDLEKEELPDGDYRVELFRKQAKAPTTSVTLRLRSADVPDRLQWEKSPSLGHSLSRPLSVLFAQDVDETEGWTRGAVPATGSDTSLVAAARADLRQAWWEVSDATAAPVASTWRLASVKPDSCMFTGAHYLLVPEDRGGRPVTPFVDSTCRDCGLVKRVAVTAWAARRRGGDVKQTVTVPKIDVTKIASVPGPGMSRWALALDAACYLGGGDYSLLEKLALQVEESALFVDHFVRTMEVLGHIEVQRDLQSLVPTAWETTPTTLAETADGRWSLLGHWPGALSDTLQVVVEAAGGKLVLDEQDNGPQCWSIVMPSGALPSLPSDLREVAIVPKASEAMAVQLGPLGSLLPLLPRRSADLSGEFTQFSPLGANWVKVPGLGAPGAYRVKKWAVSDLIQTNDDVNQGRAARSTVQLSKHAAALAYGRPLVCYDKTSQDLSVPLGADLPGLYGRAAVLASGQPPRADRKRRRLVYSLVPEKVALTIARLISC